MDKGNTSRNNKQGKDTHMENDKMKGKELKQNMTYNKTLRKIEEDKTNIDGIEKVMQQAKRKDDNTQLGPQKHQLGNKKMDNNNNIEQRLETQIERYMLNNIPFIATNKSTTSSEKRKSPI